MYERAQLAAVIVLAVVWGLSWLARRRPDIGWLQPFQPAFPRLSAEQRQQARRRADFHAGVQFILLGIAVPLGLGALNLMFFSNVSATELVVTAAIATCCFVLGGVAIRRSYRR